MTVSILVATKIPSTVQISSPKPQIICENAQPKPRKPLKLQAFQAVSKSVGNATKKAQPPLVAVLFSCFEASLHLCHLGYESDERARWVSAVKTSRWDVFANDVAQSASGTSRGRRRAATHDGDWREAIPGGRRFTYCLRNH